MLICDARLRCDPPHKEVTWRRFLEAIVSIIINEFLKCNYNVYHVFKY